MTLVVLVSLHRIITFIEMQLALAAQALDFLAQADGVWSSVPGSRGIERTELGATGKVPVYALLIGAFIPQREVWGVLELQGLVLMSLYLAGVVGALAVAWVLKRFTAAGRQVRPLMMELPSYHWPSIHNIAIGIW